MDIHLSHLQSRRPELAPLIPDLEKAFHLMLESLRQDGQLLLCGNGGSAADCDHIAGELLKGFKSKRPLGEAQTTGLSEHLATKLQNGIRAIPLTGFSALSSAFINDVDPLMTFAQLVWALGRKGDILLAISTSGNAVNVAHAAEAARAKGMTVIGLSGQSGGKLKSLSDICICAPSTETFIIQEYHLPIYHTWCLMLEAALYPQDTKS
jgi:D-sedoheptulose 7-phosphate isomerase